MTRCNGFNKKWVAIAQGSRRKIRYQGTRPPSVLTDAPLTNAPLTDRPTDAFIEVCPEAIAHGV